MRRFIRGLEKTIEGIMAATLAVMVVLVFGNAAARYALDSGLAEAEEISRLAFVWLIFLGAILAVRERAHVGVNLLVRRLPRRGKQAALVLTNALTLYALWLFAEGSWQQTVIGLKSQAPVTGLPLAAFAAAGLVGALAMGLLIALDLLRAVLGHLPEEALVQVRDHVDHEEAAETLRDLPSPPLPRGAAERPGT